uniref:Nucleotide-binding oligomerization domain containing 1 n=1 Tax=Cyprinus carpio TaxID=7962 RepID=A0A8C1KWP0_CYPCA
MGSYKSEGSHLKLLTSHRELLVERVKNTQCVLDNLQMNGFICTEDIEIILRSSTKTDQVRKILELVQSKGEECSAYFVHVLHEAYDAYIDLRPWFEEIRYTPLDTISVIPVVNTDPISKYCEKLRYELGRDTQFITSYSKREETPLEDLYTDTQMELLNDRGESLGYLQSLDELLGDQGVFNPQAETIFITGDAGVGKSIVLQKLQNLWSRRELKTRAKFFFKFRCRMFSTFKETDEISLKDLIFKHNCYPDGDLDNEVFTYILRFPETVLFTFDGYDEIQTDFDLDNVPETVSPEEKTRPLLLLMNLLCGKLLKGSRKILTARSGTEIQSRVIWKKVYMKGFSPDHLKRYTALHFPETEHRKMVTDQLDANPHLCGLCSIPLFSWIILKSFKHLHSVYDNFELPDSCITLTNVFLLLSEVFLGHSTARPGLLKGSTRCPTETFKAGEQKLAAFARLALNGLQRGGLVFSMEEVTSCGLEDEVLQFGFLRPASHYDGCGGSATFEFLHETLQAFLAAFSLVLDSKITPESILSFFSKCEYKRSSHFSCMPCLGKSRPRDKDPFQTNFQFTNLFLCGLLSKPNAALLEHLVPPALLKQKRKMLKSYLSNSVRTHLKGLPRYPSTDIDGDKVHAMPNFLWMLRCIFETNSEEVAKMTANGISADYIKIAFCNIYSADCSALNFVLHHRRKHLGVDMDNNNINDYGVKQLRPSFSKMTVVRFCVNQLTDSSIEVLAEELIRHKVVRVLGLYKNYITDVGAKLVAKIIEECPHLRVVKLGCNNITGVGGKYLASAIHKSKSIFDVGMWGNTIGDEGADAFAEALKNHPSLTNLRLIENEFTIHGAKEMSEGLTNNTTLKEVNIKGSRVSEEEEQLYEGDKRLRFH